MTRRNGNSGNGNTGSIEDLSATEGLDEVSISPLPPGPLPEAATRAKQRTKQQVQQNGFIIVAAGAVVTALLIFVAVSVPHRGGPQKTKSRGAVNSRIFISHDIRWG